MHYLLNDEKFSPIALTYKAIQLNYTSAEDLDNDPTLTMRVIEDMFIENDWNLVKVSSSGKVTDMTF